MSSVGSQLYDATYSTFLISARVALDSIDAKDDGLRDTVSIGVARKPSVMSTAFSGIWFVLGLRLEYVTVVKSDMMEG